MTPQVVSVGSVTTSAPIPLDYKQNPFSVAIAVTLGGGSLTYKVQHTLDNIYDSSITPTWFDHSSVSGTADKDGNYAFPVRAVRLNVTAWTSGSAKLTVLQGV